MSEPIGQMIERHNILWLKHMKTYRLASVSTVKPTGRNYYGLGYIV